MKVFYCTIPYQSPPNSYRYEPVGNQALKLDMEVSFPILAAIAGYVSPGEAFRVVAAGRQTSQGKENWARFHEQLERLCREKGLLCPTVDQVELPLGEGVTQQARTFQNWIAYARDEDEIFACMTYGSKPLAVALMLAIQYGCRVKRGASIACVVYGEVNWAKDEGGAWSAKIYDMTALVQLDEIVRRLADRQVADPRGAIEAILDLPEGKSHGE